MKKNPQTVGFRPGERNVFLHILTACNLSCSHCYINPQQHGTGTLSRQQLEKWIHLFADRKRRSNIIFLGGEPTMHKDLPYAIEIAKTCGFNTTVDSNGYLFHDFLNRVNPQQLDYLSFSLDGPEPAVNDPIRGAGVFEVCTANIRKAKEKGFCTSLIYTVSSRNIGALPRMVPLLKELEVSRFFIQVIGLRGKSARKDENGGGLQVDTGQWLSVVPDVAAQVAELGMTVIFPKVYLTEKESFSCAGNVAENFFVFPNGRVYQCPLCEDHPLHSYEIIDDCLVERTGLTEKRFFSLAIAEGCVMNKLLQPDTIEYFSDGRPQHRISCCLLKQRL
ncbi:MAG: heme biosynthesis protein [Desulfobacterales bacterium]|nr:MAG: heme biosynthesis protein [Desulfobacterales bacterium]